MSEQQAFKELSQSVSLSKININNSLTKGIYSIVDDLAHGAIKNIEKHPVKLAENFGIGLVAGIGLSLAPELAIPVIAYTGFKLYENHQKILKTTEFLAKDAHMLFHADKYSKQTLKLANKNMAEAGGFIPDVIASLAGGISGSIATRSVASLLSESLNRIALPQSSMEASSLVNICDNQVISSVDAINTSASTPITAPDILSGNAVTTNTLTTESTENMNRLIESQETSENAAIKSGLKILKRFNKLGKIANRLGSSNKGGYSIFTDQNSGNLKK